VTIRKKTRKVLEKVCAYANGPRTLQHTALGFHTLEGAQEYKEKNVCEGAVITCIWEDTARGEQYNFCVTGYAIKKCKVS
jgi:hypothetical protein